MSRDLNMDSRLIDHRQQSSGHSLSSLFVGQKAVRGWRTAGDSDRCSQSWVCNDQLGRSEAPKKKTSHAADALEDQNSRLEYDALLDWQPVKFLKYWQDVNELTGFSDKTSGGVLKTLQLVTWLATHTN